MRKSILLLAIMVSALVLASGVALADQVTCSSDPCLGTTGPDMILGTNDAEMIRALAGNDNIDAMDGADTIYGGLGRDGIGEGVVGGNGSDTSYGGAQPDLLSEYDYNSPFNCTFQHCTGRDSQYGGGSDDFLEGGDEGDFLYGGGGSDEMYGDPGNDLVSGDGGDDDIQGEEGDDDLRGGPGDDFIGAADEETAGSVDTVSCGRGRNDKVVANKNDVVANNCERVITRPNATATEIGGASASLGSADDGQKEARDEFLARSKQDG